MERYPKANNEGEEAARNWYLISYRSKNNLTFDIFNPKLTDNIQSYYLEPTTNTN